MHVKHSDNDLLQYGCEVHA